MSRRSDGRSGAPSNGRTAAKLYTGDGVHYFETRRALEDWYKNQTNPNAPEDDDVDQADGVVKSAGGGSASLSPSAAAANAPNEAEDATAQLIREGIDLLGEASPLKQGLPKELLEEYTAEEAERLVAEEIAAMEKAEREREWEEYAKSKEVRGASSNDGNAILRPSSRQKSTLESVSENLFGRAKEQEEKAAKEREALEAAASRRAQVIEKLIRERDLAREKRKETQRHSESLIKPRSHFTAGDKVVFRSKTRENRKVKGVVAPDDGQGRRTNNIAHYKVIYREEDADSDDEDAVVGLMTDFGRDCGNVTHHLPPQLTAPRRNEQRFLQHCELVPESILVHMDEHVDRLIKGVMKALFINSLENAMFQWKEMVREQQWKEKELKSSLSIQCLWRAFKARIYIYKLRRKIEKKRRAQARKERRMSRMQIKQARAKERKKMLRKRGVTIDGKNFFATKAELRAWAKIREDKYNLVNQAFKHLARNSIQGGWERWIEFMKDTNIVAIEKEIELARQRREIFKEQIKGKTAGMRPWHPAMGIRLRALPGIGAKTRLDGSVELIDFRRYNSFKEFISGPLDVSYWMIKDLLLCGGYPEGQARLASTVTARGNTESALLLAGITTYVCLCTKDELASKTKSFEEMLLERHDRIKRELDSAVRSAAMAHKIALSAVTKAQKYKREERARVQKIAMMKAEVEMKAKSNLDAFPKEVSFIYFPIEKGKGADEAKLLTLLEEIEDKLRQGRKAYIFSATGHGRAPMVAACLLGRLYSLKADETIERMRMGHTGRGDVMHARAHNMKLKETITVPDTATQQQMIRQVLSVSEEMYKSIYRKDKDLHIMERRTVQRGIGVPVFNPPEIDPFGPKVPKESRATSAETPSSPMVYARKTGAACEEEKKGREVGENGQKAKTVKADRQRGKEGKEEEKKIEEDEKEKEEKEATPSNVEDNTSQGDHVLDSKVAEEKTIDTDADKRGDALANDEKKRKKKKKKRKKKKKKEHFITRLADSNVSS